MSGIKYRTLSDTEYNRLQREASQGRVAASRAEAAERANRQLQRDLDAQSAYNASLASRIGELDR